VLLNEVQRIDNITITQEDSHADQIMARSLRVSQTLVKLWAAARVQTASMSLPLHSTKFVWDPSRKPLHIPTPSVGNGTNTPIRESHIRAAGLDIYHISDKLVSHD